MGAYNKVRPQTDCTNSRRGLNQQSTEVIERPAMNGTRKAQTLEERFWSKVVPTGFCWEWQSSKNHGYGSFGANGRTHRAHRVAYELLVGEIPEGLVIDHLCRNKACVNPDHLEPVTQQVNVLRSYRAFQSGAVGRPGREDLWTSCVWGHPLGENPHVNRKGYPDCVTCRSERLKKARHVRVDCEHCGKSIIRKNISTHVRVMHGLQTESAIRMQKAIARRDGASHE